MDEKNDPTSIHTSYGGHIDLQFILNCSVLRSVRSGVRCTWHCCLHAKRRHHQRRQRERRHQTARHRANNLFIEFRNIRHRRQPPCHYSNHLIHCTMARMLHWHAEANGIGRSKILRPETQYFITLNKFTLLPGFSSLGIVSSVNSLSHSAGPRVMRAAEGNDGGHIENNLFATHSKCTMVKVRLHLVHMRRSSANRASIVQRDTDYYMLAALY